MGFKLSLLPLYLLLALSACDKKDDALPITKETEHFILYTDTKSSDTKEVDKVLERAEELYPKISRFLGDNWMLQKKIIIRLEGPFIEQGPFFDHRGIHLFRYSEEENGYLALLAHEMVHAFREEYYKAYDPWRWDNYPFLDEGLAEYIAQLTDPGKTGFPMYGFDEYAVVGNLAISNRLIPPDTLRAQHHEINDPCNIQAYPQRSTWMAYIDETFGRDTLLRLNYPEVPPTDEYFVQTLGISLMGVDSAWKSWIVQKYHNIPQASQIVAAYRERTSWCTMCEY